MSIRGLARPIIVLSFCNDPMYLISDILLLEMPLGLTPFALKVRLKGVTGSSQATSLGWFLASHQAGWVPVAYFPQETLPP